MSNDHVHPFFKGLLDDVTRQSKQHLQSQAPIARKRDVVRFNALHKGWQECGDLISFGTFVAAVDAYEAARAEAVLDAQYDYERNRRQAELDTRIEQEDIEKRERDAQRARS